MTNVNKIRAVPSETPANRREQRRLETRQRIFEAALAEFVESGFQKAQIDRIVERAGVARGTFYFHFPTKEHVLLELQKREQQSVADRVAVRLGGAETLTEYLRQVMHAILEEESNSAVVPELMREMLAMYVRQPQAALVQPMQEPLIVSMIDQFHEYAERGEVRDDLSPEELVGTFMRSIFGCVAIDVDGGERVVGIESFIDIFVKGITK
jgi:TetR/AcrR family transcriptional repressor of uid operon